MVNWKKNNPPSNKPKFLIKNAGLLCVSTGLESETGDILIENGLIRQIGISLTNTANAKIIDAAGMIAIPGFVQTHVHLCQTLFRNIANDLELLDWLEHRIWPLEAAHTPESLAISARLGILELIKSGTTTILDMGSVHNTETIFREVAASGLRACIGITFMDQGKDTPTNLLRPSQDSFIEADHLYQTWHLADLGRLMLNLAPRFALSCTPATLRQIAETAREKKLLVHTHASENRKEVVLIRSEHGLGNVAYYHHLGMTGTNLCLAHCIWLDDEEIAILAETDSRVLHCPTSNLKLGSGIADIPRYLAKGITCSLGADGAPCNNNLNMLQEMRLAGLIQKPHYGASAMPAKILIDLATRQGARAMHLEDQIGTLAVGKKADLILVDLHSAQTSPGTDYYAQLVYAAQPENIRTVIIDGELVMENRRVLTIDEPETLCRAEEELRLLLKRANLA